MTSKIYNIRVILFCLTGIFYLSTFGQNPFSDSEQISKSESKIYQKYNNNNFKYTVETENYDLKYHRLEWEINPDTNYIQGKVTSYFQVLVSNFNKIYFDLHTSLNVDSVVYNGLSQSFNHLSNNVLEINLPTTIPIYEIDSITVFYQGIPTGSGFGSFVKSTHNSQNIIWTLSEPFGALEWWPCKQTLNDKIDSIDVIVKTPKINKVASQGILTQIIDDGTYKTYHWKHRYPIATYLISLAVTNYAEFTINANLTTGSLPILNYVYPEDSATAYPSISLIQPIIKLYDSLFTPYPFQNEKYGHAQFGWGGGMEHQTMSSMGFFSEHLMSHELAHQWFGDKVTCSGWSDIWLNEGFATFCTGLFYKHVATPWWLSWRENTVASVTSAPDGSVYNPDSTNVSRIFSSRLTYNKGAMLLRMLEWKLGDTIFYPAVRNYLTDTNISYGFSTTQLFKQHLEQQSSVDLTEFFNDWFYGQGYPSYQITWNQLGNTLNFWVNQSQSHNSVSFFEMPIPIYLSGQGFDTTLIFNHTFTGEYFTATIPFTVDSISFDPELWIISKNNSFSVGVDDLLIEDNLVIYPNPTSDKLYIKTSLNIKNIVVFDVLGKKLENIESKQIIDLTRYKSGVYIVEIESNNEYFRKFISKN